MAKCVFALQPMQMKNISGTRRTKTVKCVFVFAINRNTNLGKYQELKEYQMIFGAGYCDRSTRNRIVDKLSKGVIKFPSEILWSCTGIHESDRLLCTCYFINGFTDARCL